MKTKYRQLKDHPLLKNSLIYVITDAINKTVPFLLLPLLTFYLSPSEYGIVANYNVLVNLLVIIISVNAHSSLSINFYKLEKYDIAKYIFNILILTVISLFLCTILLLIFQTELSLLIKIQKSYLFGGLAIAFCQVISTINLTLWRLEESPLKFGVYQITQTILDLSISLILIIWLHMNWHGRLMGIGISATLYGTISIILLWRKGYIDFNVKASYIKEAFKFGFPLIPHSISIWARSGVDRIIISALIGTAASGIYATGFQFGLVVSFITLAFSNAYSPYLYKSLSISNPSNLAQKKRQLVKLTHFYTVALFILTIFAVFACNFVIDHYLSDKYSDAKRFIAWALFSQAFQGIYLMYVGYIFFVKKSAQLAWITFSCSVFQVILSYFLVKSQGSIGAAYSNFITSILNCVAVVIFSAHVYKMPWLSLKK